MATQTKAQLQREASRLAEMEAAEKSYPTRLMGALEKANEFYFELKVRDGVFLLASFEHPNFNFTYNYHHDSDLELEQFRDLLCMLEAERLEQNLKEGKKKDALAKLTQEEKVLLGL